MGTMISPGPWLAHAGSVVNVGVSVRVGTGVSVAGSVDVCVGNRSGVTVAAGVGDEDGLYVNVGVSVGEAGAIRLNAPQLMRNKASADIPINDFCKCLQWMIQIPENPQALEREPRRNDLDHVRFLSNDRGKPTCGNHLHIIAQLLAEALYHALDHADIAKQQTRLHRMDRV